MAAADTGAHLDALYPAAAMVLVALIGLGGNWLQSRRRTSEPDPTADLDLITGLASTVSEERTARAIAERQAAIWEERARAAGWTEPGGPA